jgi:DNA-binding IclR family transcriptional regulator
MPVSTVYRFLRELRRFGLVMELSEREYTVGSTLVELALGTPFYALLQDEIEPTLHRLVLKSGETAMAVVREGLGARTISQVESASPIRLSFRVGEVRPLHAGASATALLAFQAPALIEAVIERARSENIELDEQELRERLQQIRTEGNAVSKGEVDPDVVSVSCPVFYGGQVFAAISIAGPSNRFEHRLDEMIELVVSETRLLNGNLAGAGFGSDGPPTGQ